MHAGRPCASSAVPEGCKPSKRGDLDRRSRAPSTQSCAHRRSAVSRLMFVVTDRSKPAVPSSTHSGSGSGNGVWYVEL